MLAPPFKDKFVAFIDVMGFKAMIEAAEKGEGRSLAEIEEILADLARVKDKTFYAESGPQICPMAKRSADHLDFEITQVNDCVVVSAEVSPAGVVNIVNHCWAIVLTLLARRSGSRLCHPGGHRSHRGPLLRDGYHRALAGEPGAKAFAALDEKGTPFIEIDPVVRAHVDAEGDDCDA